MNSKQIQQIKEWYKLGTRIKLVSMDGKPDMAPGLVGVVTHEFCAGQIHVKWENGVSTSLIFGIDKFIAFTGPTASEYLRERYGPEDKIWFREGDKCYRAVIIGVDRLIEETEHYADKIVGITSKLAEKMGKPYNTVSAFDAFLNDHVLTDERTREIQQKREYTEGESEENQCPKCCSSDLAYGQTMLEESYVTSPWTCQTCGAKGKEYGRIEFDGHYVDKLPDDDIAKGGTTAP